MYGQKHGEIGVLAERMNTGLSKLVEATKSVNVLSQELVVKEKELEVASKKADVVLKVSFHVCKLASTSMSLYEPILFTIS